MLRRRTSVHLLYILLVLTFLLQWAGCGAPEDPLVSAEELLHSLKIEYSEWCATVESRLENATNEDLLPLIALSGKEAAAFARKAEKVTGRYQGLLSDRREGLPEYARMRMEGLELLITLFDESGILFEKLADAVSTGDVSSANRAKSEYSSIAAILIGELADMDKAAESVAIENRLR